MFKIAGGQESEGYNEQLMNVYVGQFLQLMQMVIEINTSVIGISILACYLMFSKSN